MKCQQNQAHQMSKTNLTLLKRILGETELQTDKKEEVTKNAPGKIKFN